MRSDLRTNDELRPVRITPGYSKHANGSALIEEGDTRVICTATVEDKVPAFLKGTGRGWLTGEYAMLPASTQLRKARESSRGKVEGRTHEIQRLIGRSLRSIINLDGIGERTIWIDCDVIQADGGTRTASITGGFVALVYCIKTMIEKGMIEKSPIIGQLAAVSAGIYDGQAVLDLSYEEDSKAKVDMNLVMTDKNEFTEIQGTGEEDTFTLEELQQILTLGEAGIQKLLEIQKEALGNLINLVGN
ncbi:MAG TPA: ribonuclease PH [Clostridiales bacterium]|nr:ribonuclease PH [Clostridia bacterium]HCS73293.1 ribonuclease PH [Clostridiales bacterium]